MKIRHLSVAIISVIIGLSVEADAAGLSKSLLRSSRRNVVRTLTRTFDLKRDYRTAARSIRKPRLVDRYISSSTASRELKKGIPAYRHMTSVSTRRPLSALSAQKRLGLAKKPHVVERIRLPQGTRLKFNKVVGGKPGYGEITVPSRVPRSAIVKQLRLR